MPSKSHDGGNLDQVRSLTLQRIERNERNLKLSLAGAAAWELFFLVAFIVKMEHGNRLHVLLLIATVGSYTVVVLGLIVLGIYLNRGNLRLLKAIELLKDELEETRG